MVALVAVAFIVVEARTSYYVQSPVLSRLVAGMGFAAAPGPSPRIRFPASGPYDQRLGYTHLPQWIAGLQARGYAIEEQAVLSPQLEKAVERGVFPLYHEKQQAGLEILDRQGTPVFSSRYPRAIYETYEAIPPLIVSTLTFIEDRGAVDPGLPNRNPAIAWERLGQALVDQVEQIFDPGHNAAGGSTLATQLEKFRHSDRGITPSITEKLRQVSSASLRAYLDGPNTLAWRAGKSCEPISTAFRSPRGPGMVKCTVCRMACGSGSMPTRARLTGCSVSAANRRRSRWSGARAPIGRC